MEDLITQWIVYSLLSVLVVLVVLYLMLSEKSRFSPPPFPEEEQSKPSTSDKPV